MLRARPVRTSHVRAFPRPETHLNRNPSSPRPPSHSQACAHEPEEPVLGRDKRKLDVLHGDTISLRRAFDLSRSESTQKARSGGRSQLVPLSVSLSLECAAPR